MELEEEQNEDPSGFRFSSGGSRVSSILSRSGIPV